jgi:DNA helicase-2/ATP-dependent DNA helicase PcrA
MIDLLASLNEKQQEAVVHKDGPLLVVAGAGSGKTKALTHRIANLVINFNVHPSNILAVTFTNKAAMEMTNRIGKLLSEASFSSLPTVGTFHSICVRILRKHIHELDYENSYVIYDDTDQQILVKNIMKDLDIDDKKFNPRAILYSISQAKNQLISATEFSNKALDYFSEKVATIYRLYQDQLKRNNALDFDDLIMKTVELFKKKPELLEFYQDKFKYISVDEYQDTNHAQYVLIRQLSDKYRNLCVIGDSDQSIYSWRGANMQNILDFEKDFPDCKVVLLEQNYRSTKTILKAAHQVIVKNNVRKEKKLWTDNDEGDTIHIYEAFNERDEGMYVVNRINEILTSYEYPTYSDFAVLYRTNAQSRVIEEAFLRYAIPYKIVGGIKFYDRKEIKDILSYLKVITNPHDSISLLRIINTPSRKIGNSTLNVINSFASENRISFFKALSFVDQMPGLGRTKIADLQKFLNLILKLSEKAKSERASAVIKYVIEDSGYKKMLVEEGSTEAESRIENISELISVASKYDSLEPGLSLNIFLEEVALISDLDNLPESQNSVTMMTLHAAKGLEFSNVFMIGLEEGIFPHSRSLLDPEQLEEERRLMYVGITRAEKRLSLCFARQRMLFGEMQANQPSQFLNDIPREIITSNSNLFRDKANINTDLMGNKPIPYDSEVSMGYQANLRENSTDFKDGDKVKHPAFGTGIIVSVLGGVATVAFNDPKVGVKKLALSVAPLEKI